MTTLRQYMDVLSAACDIDVSSCEFRVWDSKGGVNVTGCTVAGCRVWIYLLHLELEQRMDAYVLTSPLYGFASLGPHLKTWRECVGYYRLYPLSSVTIKELCPSLVLSRAFKRLGL